MNTRPTDLPLFVLLFGLASLVILVPVWVGVVYQEWTAARNFFYASIFLSTLTCLLVLAFWGRSYRLKLPSHGLVVVLVFFLFPLFFAFPMALHLTPASILPLYFDMLSCFATSGFGSYQMVDLPHTLEFWRGFVAWLGGLFWLVCGLALFRRLNVAGFDIVQPAKNSSITGAAMRGQRTHDHAWMEALQQILPLYSTATLVIYLYFAASGHDLFDSAMWAMSTLSTSGIGPDVAGDNLLGSLLIMLILLLSLSHLFYRQGIARASFVNNRELKAGLAIAGCAVIVFLFHQAGQGRAPDLLFLLEALHISVSFLVTQGLADPFGSSASPPLGIALLLLCLSCIGGGIATSAGGIKLLRLYVLFKHGARETHRLVYPHAVAGSGERARMLRREGAYSAAVFMIIFLIFAAGLALGFSFLGTPMVDALTLSLSSLSTNGHLPGLFDINAEGQTVAHMTLYTIGLGFGRLELLLIIVTFGRLLSEN